MNAIYLHMNISSERIAEMTEEGKEFLTTYTLHDNRNMSKCVFVLKLLDKQMNLNIGLSSGQQQQLR